MLSSRCYRLGAGRRERAAADPQPCPSSLPRSSSLLQPLLYKQQPPVLAVCNLRSSDPCKRACLTESETGLSELVTAVLSGWQTKPGREHIPVAGVWRSR